MKIATLIPAYKTEYLRDLILSLKTQTYKNFRIFVSDDSPGGKVTQMLRSDEFYPLIGDMKLDIVQGPRQGAYWNVEHLVTKYSDAAPLLHILMDDDVIYPRFYEYHVAIHQNPEIACTISRRWTGHESGLPMDFLKVPIPIDQNMSRAVLLDSNALFKSMVPLCNNWLGEYSNMVLKKEIGSLMAIREMGGLTFMGLEDIGIGDVGFLLQASLGHKLAFIQDCLGFFRINPHQHTGKFATHGFKESSLGWLVLAIVSMRMGKITPGEAFIAFKRMEGIVRSNYGGDEEMQEFIRLIAGYPSLTEELTEKFLALWQAFLVKHNTHLMRTTAA